MRTGLVFVVVALLSACAATDENPSEDKRYGNWQGILPCADCAGIETRLTLYRNPDRYRLMETYQGAPAGQVTFVQRGEWRLKPPETVMSLGIIVLDHTKAEKRRQFQRRPSGGLTLLNRQGEPVQSSLNYTLQRRNKSENPARSE